MSDRKKVVDLISEAQEAGARRGKAWDLSCNKPSDTALEPGSAR